MFRLLDGVVVSHLTAGPNEEQCMLVPIYNLFSNKIYIFLLAKIFISTTSCRLFQTVMYYNSLMIHIVLRH